ncbi:hypothetical protein QR680_017050 [Steinernema hermaphroditum]|uniref:CSN12-like protein n=1 Tax=Steinernema hermaphroditum TaxID=289476 RepID=A0AA39HE39_9BILA|nr:hypothetical protein QR680_017050 [Steinernema hermaphroditum]
MSRIDSLAQYYNAVISLTASETWEDAETAAALFSLSGGHAQLECLQIDDLDEEHPHRPQRDCEPWVDRLIALHLRVLYSIYQDEDTESAYENQVQMVQFFNKEVLQKAKETNWFLPILYVLFIDLRALALAADDSCYTRDDEDAPPYFEQCSNYIMECYRTCVAESRNTTRTSKKVAILNMTNQLFRIYFRVNKLNLLKPLIRAIENSGPIYDHFSMADKVTYKYFLGRKAMFDLDLKLAEDSLTYAFRNCPDEMKKNKRLILMYLVPTKMFLGHMPKMELLEKYDLHAFDDVVTSVKYRDGNLRGLATALETNRVFFVNCGIFLMLERLKVITYRTLFKRITHILNTTKVQISAFLQAAHFLGEENMDEDEASCVIANLIAQKKIKGYISHQHQMVVISKDPLQMIFAQFGLLLLAVAVFSAGANYTASSGKDELLGATEDDHFEFMTPVHYKLEAFLMKNYSKRLLPRRFLNESVKVMFSMELYQIIEVNEPSQYMLINAWIIERWYDDLLYWNPKEFGSIKQIILPSGVVWIPDTTLYNSLVMNDDDSTRLLNVKLTPDTQKQSTLVELLYPTLYQFSCMLDLRFFPFDIQARYRNPSSSHGGFRRIYNETQKGDEAIGMDQVIENEGWYILGSTVNRIEKKYECCANKYTLLEFSLFIRRKPLFYLVNLIAPTCVITLISIVGFFSSSTINEYREEKISLGITTLLSMSIMIFMVSDKMPSTSSFIPLIGWFYTCMMMLISGGTLCASIVICAQKKGILGNRPQTKTMRWARWLGRLCRLEMPLLMKEAYMEKAKLEKERLKRQSLQKRNRRQSIWQKISRASLSGAISSSNLAAIPKSTSLNTTCLKKVAVDMTNSDIPTVCCDDLEDATDEDRSFVLDNSFSEAAPPKKLPSFSRTSTMVDFDASVYSLNSGAKNAQSANCKKRNLAEIEYDWLAAVIERCFLIVFFLLFVLSSFGINAIGLYYWLNTSPEDFRSSQNS